MGAGSLFACGIGIKERDEDVLVKRTLSIGKEIVHFSYEILEIGEFTAQDIIQMGQPGLLPLLTLTRDGATRETVALMFNELETFANKNVTFIAFAVATFSFQRSNKHDAPWLEKTYRYMHDILIESPFYKEIIARGVEEGLKQGKEQGLKQGKEQGLEEGLEQGLEKGQIKALRQAVLDIIRERLPALTQFAEVQVETINDVIQLRRLIVKMSTVLGTEQARQAFLDVQRAQ
ncbi:MAG: hypothetical protein NVS2B12_12380 [Ktedonobacteraceae bacterium]